jgi:hypothetical protein
MRPAAGLQILRNPQSLAADGRRAGWCFTEISGLIRPGIVGSCVRSQLSCHSGMVPQKQNPSIRFLPFF